MSRIESEVDRLVKLRFAVERLTEELEFHRRLALPSNEASATRMRQGA